MLWQSHFRAPSARRPPAESDGIALHQSLLATTPVGSTVPGLMLAIMAAQLIMGRAEPVFPDFIMTRLAD
jgi:hypothetical protein